jgi:hypothetical protein
MLRLQDNLIIKIGDNWFIKPVTEDESQAFIDLKQIAISETYSEWASESQINQEMAFAASGQYLENKLKDPNVLMLGQWRDNNLQAIGGLEYKNDKMQLISGAAWPTNLGLAAPLTKARIQLAQSLGAKQIHAYCILANRLSAKHLKHHGFLPDGTTWRIKREPYWTMINYIKNL